VSGVAGLLGRGALVGAVLSATALAGGAVVVVALEVVGVDLGPGATGVWLGGLALLGQWDRTVTTSVPVDGSFAESLRLVPLSVTAIAVAGGVALAGRFRAVAPSRAGRVAAALGSAAVAGVLAAVVAVATTARASVTNDAGTVEVVRGLDPLAGAVGAAVVGAIVVGWGMAPPGGAVRRGWRDARALVVVPGLVVTVVAMAATGLFVLPGATVPVVVLTVAPLLGGAALLVAAGAPVVVDASVLTAQPLRLWLPADLTVAWVVGVVVVVVLAVLAGVVRGRREPRAGRVDLAVTVAWCSGVAAGVAALTRVVAILPTGLGGDVRLEVSVPVAAAIGAAAGLLTGWVAARQRGSGKRASGNTSAITTTSPDSGSDPDGTLGVTRSASPDPDSSTSVAAG